MLTTLSIRNGRIPPGEVHQQFHPAQVQRLPNSINIFLRSPGKDSGTQSTKGKQKLKET